MNLIQPNSSQLFGFWSLDDSKNIADYLGAVLKGTNEVDRWRIESVEYKNKAGIIRHYHSAEDYTHKLIELPIIIITLEDLIAFIKLKGH